MGKYWALLKKKKKILVPDTWVPNKRKCVPFTLSQYYLFPGFYVYKNFHVHKIFHAYKIYHTNAVSLGDCNYTSWFNK